jgi:hypothetical protein
LANKRKKFSFNNLADSECKDQGQPQGPAKAKQKPPAKENEKSKRSLPLNATNGDVKNVTKSKGEYHSLINSYRIFTIFNPLHI